LTKYDDAPLGSDELMVLLVIARIQVTAVKSFFL
jgi:hypothetical protein